MMVHKKIFRLLVMFIGMISLGMGVGYYYTGYYQSQVGPDIQGLLWPEPKQLRAFATIDHEGRIFSSDRLQGKWSFLFFGYTHCPDVCPITLSIFKELFNQINAAAGDVQMIFVTVDPERDTSQRLGEYVAYFNPAFIGLGGSTEQINSLTSQLGVVYMYGENSSDGNYIVDHTASVFLIDPRGRMVGIFSMPHQVDSIRDRYTMIRKFIESQS